MNRSKFLCGSVLLVIATLPLGCAHAARDTTGFALNHAVVVDAPFDATWQSVKDVLREKELDIYTRDKRGHFIALTPERRRLLQPNRYKYTIDLEAVSDNSTRVALDTRKQTYGVTLLTYPGWHDRKTEETGEPEALLEAIQARATAVAADR
ncbi:MAG: hypothetical protein KF886_00710 [Candidatus Hydrogenedentes bacterium]|nr:hypothetical protein [Candidatus Hydrogenedentota bacterium]